MCNHAIMDITFEHAAMLLCIALEHVATQLQTVFVQLNMQPCF